MTDAEREVKLEFIAYAIFWTLRKEGLLDDDIETRQKVEPIILQVLKENKVKP